FEPIAQKCGLPLIKIQEGIYEMPSPFFIQRLEAYAGHSSRGLSAMLRQATLRAFVERVPGFQCDITWFMRFNGKDTEAFYFNIVTDEDFLKMAKLFANAIEHFGISYLLGQKDDFEAVNQFVQEQSKHSVERMRQMQRNIESKMKNVRQEWPVAITREKGDEWETVNLLKADDIQFLGELDGNKERLFKEKVTKFLQSSRNAECAYLARIIGRDLPANGILCLRMQSDFDKGVRKGIGECFADVFSLQDNFNILLLSHEQESALRKVCPPFFKNPDVWKILDF
ncbi:MAG: hypothetical protein ACREFR_01930, partial [Limisphaerales bacterium]